MNTTTMIEKLLHKATDYEQKAQGLRLAAAELQLELTGTKHAQLGQQLQTAIKVRQKQRPQLRPNQHATPSDTAVRLDLIRQALATGPKTTKDLTRVLQAEGAQIGPDRVRQLLNEDMRGEVRQFGGSIHSRWALKAHRLSRDEKRARDRERKRQLRAARQETTYERKKRQAPQALDKARIVATILQKAGKPMPIKDLSQAARAEGLTKGLTGIHNLVKQGYLKHNGNGYSFVAMPEAQPGA